MFCKSRESWANMPILWRGYGTDKLTDNSANHTPKILSENTAKLILRNRHEKVIKIKV